jgi:hypothetical protein
VIKPLRRLTQIKSLDDVSRFAADIIEAWNGLAKDPFLSRQRISVAMRVGNNTITHALGYEPTGYITLAASGLTTTFLVSKSSTNVVIYSSAAVTLTIEVL